jgi:hypothetical protein
VTWWKKNVVLYICVALFISSAISLLRIAFDNDDAVRVRYALTADFGSSFDVTAAPGASPNAFVAETAPVPSIVADKIKSLDLDPPNDDFKKAMVLANHLASGPGTGKGELDTDIVSTYRAVLSDQLGDCTDYARLYAGLGYAAGLDVRIWTTSFDGFGSKGHVFSEVYTDEYGWIFLDPINSFIVTDVERQKPLSVVDFRDRLLARGPIRSLAVTPISKERFAFASAEEAIDYYKPGAERFALRLSNAVFSYDRLFWVRWLRPRSKSLEQGLSILLNRYPRLLVLETAGNAHALDSLRSLKKKVIGLLSLCFSSFAIAMLIILPRAISIRSK